MIPQSELRHYEAAARAMNEADLDGPPSADVLAARQEEIERLRSIKAAATAILDAAPWLWDDLAAKTTPRPSSSGGIMEPDCEFTPEQRLLYRAGQHSVIEWLRIVAKMEVSDE